MTIESRFPKGGESRKELSKYFSEFVLNMMDSDRPNNYLTGGLNFIGVVRQCQESDQKKSAKDRVLFAMVHIIEGVCRARASQLCWTKEEVDEEIQRGRGIYKKNTSSEGND
jgi:hypothetical protein